MIQRGANLQLPSAQQYQLNRDAIDRVIRTVLFLERVLGGRTVVVTSWARSPSSNRETGGADRSQHLIGTAIDVAVPGLTRAQLLPIVQAVGQAFGVVVPTKGSATSGNSVHIQAWPAGAVRDARALLPAYYGVPRAEPARAPYTPRHSRDDVYT